MKASKQDTMSSAVIHLQCALEYLDEVGGMQDLFKQDFKRQVKRTSELIEQKLNIINSAMTSEDITDYANLMLEKSKIYSYIDGLNTYEQIALFRNYVKLGVKVN